MAVLLGWSFGRAAWIRERAWRAASGRVLVLGLDGRCEAGAAARVRVGPDAGNGALRIMNWLIVSGLLLLFAASPLGMLTLKLLFYAI